MIWIDKETLIHICTTVNIAVLLYGGITDYLRREIPNIVPIVLILTGIVCTGNILFSVIFALMMAAFILLGEAISRAKPGNGDIKLLLAMSFSVGITAALGSMLFAGIGAAVSCLLNKQPLSRHYPFCTYYAPAYLLSGIFFFGFPAYFSSFLLVYVVLLCVAKTRRKEKTSDNKEEIK